MSSKRGRCHHARHRCRQLEGGHRSSCAASNQSTSDYGRALLPKGEMTRSRNQDANPSSTSASIPSYSPPACFIGGPYLKFGWQGRGVFAISPACHRQRRIAVSRWTLPVEHQHGTKHEVVCPLIPPRRTKPSASSIPSSVRTSGQPERVRGYRRTPQGRHPQALLPRRVPQARQLPRRTRKRAPSRRRARRQGVRQRRGRHPPRLGRPQSQTHQRRPYPPRNRRTGRGRSQKSLQRRPRARTSPPASPAHQRAAGPHPDLPRLRQASPRPTQIAKTNRRRQARKAKFLPDHALSEETKLALLLEGQRPASNQPGGEVPGAEQQPYEG